VLADVAFGPTNLGLGRAEALGVARQALMSVGIAPDELGDRSPFTLSGGEARRVALAGVLALQPQFLLLDEPTAGLDAMGRRALHDAIHSVREQTGVVVVSHDAEEFLGAADHVVVLVNGAVRFSGTRDEVMQDPHVLETDGLSAPDVLRVQMMAREHGLELRQSTLDPATAALSLVAAVEANR
nr:ATP-binding cassette domain-containing protein [Actinomycetota bacterium]